MRTRAYIRPAPGGRPYLTPEDERAQQVALGEQLSRAMPSTDPRLAATRAIWAEPPEDPRLTEMKAIVGSGQPDLNYGPPPSEDGEQELRRALGMALVQSLVGLQAGQQHERQFQLARDAEEATRKQQQEFELAREEAAGRRAGAGMAAEQTGRLELLREGAKLKAQETAAERTAHAESPQGQLEAAQVTRAKRELANIPVPPEVYQGERQTLQDELKQRWEKEIPHGLLWFGDREGAAARIADDVLQRVEDIRRRYPGEHGVELGRQLAQDALPWFVGLKPSAERDDTGLDESGLMSSPSLKHTIARLRSVAQGGLPSVAPLLRSQAPVGQPRTP